MFAVRTTSSSRRKFLPGQGRGRHEGDIIINKEGWGQRPLGGIGEIGIEGAKNHSLAKKTANFRGWKGV